MKKELLGGSMIRKIGLLTLFLFSFMTYSQSFTALESTNITENSFSSDALYDSGYSFVRPCVADFDNDGDLDLIIGFSKGALIYFKNTGNATVFSYTKMSKPIVQISDENLSPFPVDIDNDGDIDLVVGTKSGKVYFVENLGTTGDFPTFQVGSVIVTGGVNTRPALSDADNDGDLDLFLGDDNYGIAYYINVGSVTSFSFATTPDIANVVNSTTYRWLTPAFADTDGDGDKELVCGEKDGHLVHYDKAVNGSSFVYNFTSASYAGVNFGQSGASTPFFADLNGNGNIDLIVGSVFGKTHLYDGNGSNSYSLKTDQFGYTDLTQVQGTFSSPLLVDLDNDGDLDMLIGNGLSVEYWKNVGVDQNYPTWEVVSENYLSSTYVITNLSAWDYDNDGDLDIFFGTNSGGVGLYKNNGSASSPSFTVEYSGYYSNLDACFDRLRIAYGNSSVDFADFDGDGDRDALVSSIYGYSAYFRNDDIDINQGGTDAQIDGWQSGDFVNVNVGITYSSSFVKYSLGNDAVVSVCDVDGDGDMDILNSNVVGKIFFSRNNGTPDAYSFGSSLTSVDYGGIVFDSLDPIKVNGTICAKDINGDGWYDIVMGGASGGIRIFMNDAASDTQAPSVPGNFSALALNHEKVKLSWDRVTEAGGTGVGKYVLKRYLGSASSPEAVFNLPVPCPLSYFDTGLTQETDYNYEILAVDNAGNESIVATASASTGLPPQLDHFEFVIPSSIVDSTFSLTVKAIDNYGEVFTSFNNSVNLAVSDGVIAPVSVVLSNGQATITVTYSKDTPTGEIIVTITATYSSTVNTTGNIHLDIIPPNDPNLSVPLIVDEHTVQLFWSGVFDEGGSPEYFVDVYRNNVKITTTSGVTTTYTDSNLSPETTYVYKLRARDTVGNVSAYSVDRSVTTPAPTVDEIPPSTPTGLISSATGTDYVNLRWNPSTDTGGSGLAGYEIFIRLSKIAESIINQYSVGGLTPDTEYTFFVRAFDNSGNISGYSDSLTVRTEATTGSDTTPPTVPLNLQGTVDSDTSISIWWESSTDYGTSGLAGYKVYRSDKGDSIPYASVAQPTTGYTDSACNPGTSYTYKVKSYDNAGNTSDFSNTKTLTTTDSSLDTEPPTIPDNFTGSSSSPYTVQLSWNASSDNVIVSGYHVYFVEKASNPFQPYTYTLIGTTSNISYSVTGLAPETEYKFSVDAYDNSGNRSNYASYIIVTTISAAQDDTAPNPPENVRFGEVRSQHIVVEYDVAVDNNNSNGSPGSGIKQYHIFRNSVEVDVISGTVYEDTNITVGETYSYYVKSEDYNSNVSVTSATITATVPDEDNVAPTTPSNITASVTPSKVVLNWGISLDEGSGVNYYEVYRTILSTPFRVARSTAPIGTTIFTTYTDIDVTPGVEYQYKIRAVDVVGNASSFGFYTVTIPDTGEEDLTLYFPHIDSGDQWWTGFTVVNVSEVKANIKLTFYGSDGEEISVLEDYTELEPGMKMVSTVRDLFGGITPEGIAWLKVESDQKISGFELFGTNDGKEMVGVKISSAESSKLLFPAIEVSETLWTGIAIINLGDSIGSTTFKAYDSSGNLVGTSSPISLNPNGKVVDLVQNFFSDSILPEGTALVKAESTTNIIGFELFGYSTQDGLAGLSAVPVSESSAFNKIIPHNQKLAAVESPRNLVATVLNSSQVELQWDAPSSGTPDSYKIYTAEIVSTPFGTTVNLLDVMGITSNLIYTVSGLEPATDYNFVVVAMYGETQSNPSNYVEVTTYSSTTEEKYTYVIPRIEELIGGKTFVSTVNLSNDIASLKVSLIKSDGTVTSEKDISIVAKGKHSFEIGTLFVSLTDVKAVMIVSDKELVAYEVFEKEGEVKSYDTLFAFSKGLSEIDFAHIAPEVNQWDSNLSIWNLSKLYENTITLELYNSYGTLLLSTERHIPAGGVLSGEIHDFIDDDTLLQQNCWLKVKGQYSINGYLSFGTKDGGRLSAIEGE